MLKKTIKYIDYDENEREEDFYFNLSKAELAEMDFGQSGGMVKFLEKMVAEQDTVRLSEMFKEVILQSYGEKSADGKRFIKSKELSTAFSQTEAYVNLYMELIGSAEVAAAFINGVIPKVPPSGPVGLPPATE